MDLQLFEADQGLRALLPVRRGSAQPIMRHLSSGLAGAPHVWSHACVRALTDSFWVLCFRLVLQDLPTVSVARRRVG
jgi:hypothetical protein